MDAFSTLLAEDWTGLIFDIERRSRAVGSDGGGYLVVNVDRSDDPFVQFLVGADGSIAAEASATVVVDPETLARAFIDSFTVDRILGLGWLGPTADPLRIAEPNTFPNFHRSSGPGGGVPFAMFAELAVRTIVEAFRVQEPRMVAIRVGRLSTAGVPERA